MTYKKSPSGTGYIHITDGKQDASAQLISATDSPALTALIAATRPDIQVLAAMDEATYSGTEKSGNNYILPSSGGLTDESSGELFAGDSTAYVLIWEKTITVDAYKFRFQAYNANGATSAVGITLNDASSASVVQIQTGDNYNWQAGYLEHTIALVQGDVIRFWMKRTGATSSTIGLRNIGFYPSFVSGNMLSAAISVDAAILSFYKQLRALVSAGTSTHATPVQAEIYGNADAYAAALNATTKFTIDPADPRIILKRDALDTITASSGSQTVWNMTVAGGMAAKPNHGTILATEIGVASVLVVEKSVLGDFTDAIVLIENTDYVLDYSTRTATKITLTSGTGIVNAQSKLRLSWIADVVKVAATHNTALKVKLYLNRTNIGETSPSIQPIAQGTEKYVNMEYGT